MGAGIDVALVNPPGLWKLDDESPAKLICENLGLQYVAAAVESAGFRVDYRDAFLEGWSNAQTVDHVLQTKAPIVGVSIMFPAVEDPAIKLIQELRRRQPELCVVVGGASPTLNPQKFQAVPEIDHVVRGEGESELIGLIRAYRIGQKRSIDSQILHLRPSLNGISRPKHVYRDFVRRKCGSFLISTSRGCIANCSFCAIKSLYPDRRATFRNRDFSDVFEEICEIHTSTGSCTFVFTDDNFLNGSAAEKARRAEEFCKASERAGFKGNIYLDLRAPDAAPHILDPLKSAGVAMVFIGIEAGCPGDLAYYQKGASVDDNTLALRAVQEAGLGLEFGFITYHPESSQASVDQNIKFLASHGLLGPGHLVSRLKLFPGTKLHERYEGASIVDPSESTFGYRFCSPEIEQLFQLGRRVCATFAGSWDAYDRANWKHWMLTPSSQRSDGQADMLRTQRAALSDAVFRAWETSSQSVPRGS